MIMKHRTAVGIGIGIAYVVLFLLLARYDLAVSQYFTARCVDSLVWTGRHIGLMPVYLVPAWCMIVLAKWRGNPWYFHAAVLVMLFAGAYSLLHSDLTMVSLAAGTIGTGILLYLILLRFPVPAYTERRLRIVIAGILASVLSFGVVHLLKATWGRPRFYTIALFGIEFTPWYKVQGFALRGDAFYSFPSAHAVSASAIFFLTMLPMLFPSAAKKSIGIMVGTILFTGFVCLSRIMAGMHYLSDVMAGTGIYLLTFAIIKKWVYMKTGDNEHE